MIDKVRKEGFNIPCRVYREAERNDYLFSFLQPVKSISTKELADLSEKNSRILDVRTPQEYRAGHIKQALNVPLAKIDTYRGKKEEVVYVICQSGMRSKQAAKQLKKNGYEVINVRGGMNQWSGKKVGGR